MPFAAPSRTRPRIVTLACAGLVAFVAGCGGATASSPPGTLTPIASNVAAATGAGTNRAPTNEPPSPSPSASTRCGVTQDASASATIRVTKDDAGLFSFDGPVTVKAGQAVAFVNGPDNYHTVTEGVDGVVAADACANALLTTRTTVVITFALPGTYNFTCVPHPLMQTKVIVK